MNRGVRAALLSFMAVAVLLLPEARTEDCKCQGQSEGTFCGLSDYLEGDCDITALHLCVKDASLQIIVASSFLVCSQGCVVSGSGSDTCRPDKAAAGSESDAAALQAFSEGEAWNEQPYYGHQTELEEGPFAEPEVRNVFDDDDALERRSHIDSNQGFMAYNPPEDHVPFYGHQLELEQEWLNRDQPEPRALYEAEGEGSDLGLKAREEELDLGLQARGLESDLGLDARGEESYLGLEARGEESDLGLDARLDARGEESYLSIEARGLESDLGLEARGEESYLGLDTRGVESYAQPFIVDDLDIASEVDSEKVVKGEEDLTTTTTSPSTTSTTSTPRTTTSKAISNNKGKSRTDYWRKWLSEWSNKRSNSTERKIGAQRWSNSTEGKRWKEWANRWQAWRKSGGAARARNSSSQARASRGWSRWCLVRPSSTSICTTDEAGVSRWFYNVTEKTCVQVENICVGDSRPRGFRTRQTCQNSCRNRNLIVRRRTTPAPVEE